MRTRLRNLPFAVSPQNGILLETLKVLACSLRQQTFRTHPYGQVLLFVSRKTQIGIRAGSPDHAATSSGRIAQEPNEIGRAEQES